MAEAAKTIEVIDHSAKVRAAVEIRNRWTGAVLASGTGSIREVIEAAVLGRADLTDANLRGADLTDANLAGAVLSGAVLSGAVLISANLIDADLTDANLADAVLRGADLRGADLTGANLIDADLSYADLAGAVLIDADLSGAVLPVLTAPPTITPDPMHNGLICLEPVRLARLLAIEAHWDSVGGNPTEGLADLIDRLKGLLPAPSDPAPPTITPAPAAEPEINWSSWQGVLGDWMVQGRDRHTGLDTAVIFCGDEAEAKRITTARPGPSEPMRPVTPPPPDEAKPEWIRLRSTRFADLTAKEQRLTKIELAATPGEHWRVRACEAIEASKVAPRIGEWAVVESGNGWSAIQFRAEAGWWPVKFFGGPEGLDKANRFVGEQEQDAAATPSATPGQLAAALYRFETAREEIGKAINEAIEDVRHTLAYEWPMTTKEAAR